MRITWFIGGSIALAALLGGLAAAGCRSESGKEVETVAREPLVVPTRARDAGATRATPEVEYSVEERARYRRHLRVGRSQADEGRYADALREFERALAVIPHDPRILSEIGWAAFQAGDYERARAANQDALRLARDVEVRAASLYNLGRLAEATDREREAAEHYRASLALRDNGVVARRLAALEKPDGRATPDGSEKPAIRAERISCAATEDEEALCQCVLAAHGDDGGGSCQREPRGVPGVELLFAGREAEEWVHLVQRSAGGWSVIADLGQVRDDPDRGSHHELEIARFEMRTIGDREVLWVETEATQSDAADDQGRQARPLRRIRKVRSLVLCPRAIDGEALACELAVPASEEIEYMARAPRPGAEDPAGAQGPGAGEPGRRAKRPEASARRLAVDVHDDGTVTVILEAGQRDEAVAPLLGTHRLW